MLSIDLSYDSSNSLYFSHYFNIRQFSYFYYLTQIPHIYSIRFHNLTQMTTIFNYIIQIIQFLNKSNNLLQFKNLRSFGKCNILLLSLFIIDGISKRSSTQMSHLLINFYKLFNVLRSKPYIFLVYISIKVEINRKKLIYIIDIMYFICIVLLKCISLKSFYLRKWIFLCSQYFQDRPHVYLHFLIVNL